MADDTAALQAALDGLKAEGYDTPNTIYLPPGTYRITRTLRWKKLYGKRIIGHGRETRIVWDGDGRSPPVMFHSNGVTSGVLFEGLVWDGAGKAEVGVNHCSSTHYESHVTHRNEAFYNLKAGIVTSYSDYFPYKQATAEVLFDNCLFVNTGTGVGFGSYNALDNTVIDCGFYYCVRGIAQQRGQRLRTSLSLRGQPGCRHLHPRRRQRGAALHLGRLQTVPPWRRTDVRDAGLPRGRLEVDPRAPSQRQVAAPLTLFDCTFTNPPDKGPPVQGWAKTAVLGLQLPEPRHRQRAGRKRRDQHSPGRRGAAVTSARQTFFRSAVKIPGKVFDARRDFGAQGDGKADDTQALRATIQAAREYGQGALAYLPHGQYRVTETLDISGHDYVIGGSGNCWQCGTRVLWGGKRPDEGQEAAVLHVRNAGDVTLEDLKVSTPGDYFDDAGMISVLHTAANAPSLVTYNDVGGFFQFRGLSHPDRVHLRMVNGIVDFDNCQRATIVAEQIYPGRHPQSKKFNTTLRVRGKDQALPKDGFLGIMTMFNAGNPYDITVEDSQSLVISDYYTEQTERVLLLKGNPGDTPGRCHFPGP